MDSPDRLIILEGGSIPPPLISRKPNDMKKLIETFAKRRASRRYADQVRLLRARVSPGDAVRVIRGDGLHPAYVMNVRTYAHGSTEVYAQGEGMHFAGWFPVEQILPEEPR
jgi:transglutaminase-like putative cysteine protease